MDTVGGFMPNTHNDKEQFKNLNKLILKFITDIDGLSTSFPFVMEALNEKVKDVMKELEVYLSNNAVEIRTKDNTKTYNMKIDALPALKKKVGDFSVATSSYRIMRRSFLVSLISIYDAFLGCLIKEMLVLKPEMLNQEEQQISLNDLITLGSIDEAKSFLLDKEISSLIRDSHLNQLKWIDKKFNTNLVAETFNKILPKFIEICEMRNLIVHCDGIVSNQYTNICCDTKYKTGDKISISKEYMAESINCVSEIGLKTAQTIWRKLWKNDLKEADNNLQEISYKLLCDENYNLVKSMLDCHIKHCDEQNRKIFIINKALAYKYSGDIESAIKIIDTEDWSASKPVFKLAIEVIKDNRDEAINLMKAIGINEQEIPKEAYIEWPLFKGIRESKEFTQTYKTIFAEDFPSPEVLPKKTIKIV